MYHQAEPLGRRSGRSLLAGRGWGREEKRTVINRKVLKGGFGLGEGGMNLPEPDIR